MWRFAAASALVALLGVAALSTQTTVIHACTPPLGEPFLDADLIIQGRVRDYAIREPTEIENPELYRVLEEIVIDVDRVLVGQLLDESVTVLHEAWLGSEASSAECYFPPRDINGQHVILGIQRSNDGTYLLPLFFGGFIGPAPDGEKYEDTLRRARDLSPEPVLPFTGIGPALSTSPNYLITAVATLGAALLLASLSIRYMSRRQT